MRFQTPQFIEVEDKLFGPLTLKQFLYLAGGAGFCAVMWLFLPFFIAVFFIIPVAGLALALAFYKVNGKPFIDIMEAAFRYQFAGKLYIWRKEPKPIVQKTEEEQEKDISSLYVPRLSDSKLKDLAWSLDIQESIYSNKAQR